MRALGQTSLARSAAAPNIPTIAEVGPAGLRGRDLLRHLPARWRARRLWSSACMPRSTPRIRSPDVRAKKFADLGADPQFGRPPSSRPTLPTIFAKWARLAKEAGLKAE